MGSVSQIQARSAIRERDWQETVVAAFRAHNWLVYHTYDSRRSAKGFPDIVAIKGARMVFLELKTDRGKMSPEQQTWLDALYYALGHQPVILAGVIRPSDWPEVEALVQLAEA